MTRHLRKVYSDEVKRFSQNSADWGGLGDQAHFPTSWDWHLTMSLLFIFFPIGCFIYKVILAVNGHGCDFEVTEERLEEKKQNKTGLLDQAFAPSHITSCFLGKEETQSRKGK